MVRRKALCDMSHKYFRRLCKKRRIEVVVSEPIPTNRVKTVFEGNEPSSHFTALREPGDGILLVDDEEMEKNEEHGMGDSIPAQMQEGSLLTENDGYPISSAFWNSADTQTRVSALSLADWAVRNGVSHTATTDLLKLLRRHPCHKDLPKNAKTLLSTPRNNNVIEMNPGVYCHLGLRRGIEQYLKKFCHMEISTIEIRISTDGLPLSQSGTNQFWPILARIVPSSYVFCVGCYYGKRKPASANEFLKRFVEEAKTLINNGLMHNSRIYTIKIHSMICDAPAKSFVLSIEGHGGYSSCTKCTTEGSYVQRRMTFPETNRLKRTNQSFLEQTDEDFHNGWTLLSEIPNFGIVSQVPLEYMHLCCIGCMKKLIRLWIKGPLRKGVRLSENQIKKISAALIALRPHIPVEFARKPRELHDIAHWKATELRLFMLYVGVIVLKDILPKKFYRHFLKLHVALRILSKKSESKEIDYAESLLKEFVQSFGVLYGPEYVSHNVHGLIHMPDDVRALGPLDMYSAFPFENHLGEIKKLIRKGEKPLEQLCNRYAEKLACEAQVDSLKCYPILKGQHTTGPLLAACEGRQYRKIELKNFTISTKLADNCCGLSDGSIMFVENIIAAQGSIYFIGRSYERISSFYNKPSESSLVDTFEIKKLSSLRHWRLDEVDKKYLKIPHGSTFIATALIHTA